MAIFRAWIKYVLEPFLIEHLNAKTEAYPKIKFSMRRRNEYVVMGQSLVFRIIEMLFHSIYS